MTKKIYPTKYQLEHLKKRVKMEIDPLIEQAELSTKSVIAELTANAELKLAKKIKADVVIDQLQSALQGLEIAQRKAQTFFSRGATSTTLKDSLNSSFKDRNQATLTSSDRYENGIMPEDCREQLRQWAEVLATTEAEKTPEGKKVKELKLYKQTAINSIFECGVPEQLSIVLEKVLKPIGIIWNKTKALQLENKGYN